MKVVSRRQGPEEGKRGPDTRGGQERGERRLHVVQAWCDAVSTARARREDSVNRESVASHPLDGARDQIALMNKKSKTIGLVAHDNRKRDLIEWVDWNSPILLQHRLVCTGTTGRLVEEGLKARLARTQDQTPVPEIKLLKSGPLGGDQQLGAMIAEGRIDVIIFFWDPMEPHPHDVDVKALLRIAVVYNIPIACNRSTADFIISSPLLSAPYAPIVKDYSAHVERKVKIE